MMDRPLFCSVQQGFPRLTNGVPELALRSALSVSAMEVMIAIKKMKNGKASLDISVEIWKMLTVNQIIAKNIHLYG